MTAKIQMLMSPLKNIPRKLHDENRTTGCKTRASGYLAAA